ncbi:MAG: universal stress protein [Myxococcales bacterium]|nr:universal stress protein [Myxococcales bacterium]
MNTILVAVDSSPVADLVIAQAVGLAPLVGAKIVLLRAVGIPVELPLEAYAMSPDAVSGLLVEAASRELDALAEKVPAELLAAKVVEIGTAWRVVCDVARREKSSLIVIGAHGHKFLDGLLGTTSARVVNNADRTVLVVRPQPSA